MSWLGFFFFLRMAVAVSSSSLRSAPEASLRESVSWQSRKRERRGILCAYIRWLFFSLWSGLGSGAILTVCLARRCRRANEGPVWWELGDVLALCRWMSGAEGQTTVLAGAKCEGDQRCRIQLIWEDGIWERVDGDERKPEGRAGVQRFGGV